jgi:hypothetical protein
MNYFIFNIYLEIEGDFLYKQKKDLVYNNAENYLKKLSR